MQHPDIDRVLRYGTLRPEETEVLNDEDEEFTGKELWGDEREDCLYEERRERELFGWPEAEP